ncbi:riboflavin synthase [Saccharibacillus sp. CPCC 101409]|uniref:riboflavin synthase n=1 Tax=Saccharibacillus sp. CPCC 101409 TaxID=3058041 RepID=UPI0026715A0E|nr:riboflavin synthase [Saccharibacillus sp. CPCC 101409]MDO3409576.1 riboflavin synthase [Saccharibacillus sp. CPCC 101409]
MFTGLIEEIGSLRRAERRGEAMVLTLGAKKVLENVAIGDSIAVNGVCLTVTSFERDSFTVDVMPQTYRSSNLSGLGSGSPVNLERALAANGRFGGHIVQGHADGTASIVSVERDQNAVVFTFEADDPHMMRYVIGKGSIAVDGVSLTVTHAGNGVFGVSIIPHTLDRTALKHKKAGGSVNIECDILGKYVEHLLGFDKRDAAQAKTFSAIDESFLSRHGFA